MSTKTVTFSILKADQSPDAFGWVDVRLVDAGGGGVIVDGAIAKRARVQLDANGEGQVDLVPNDEIAPDGTFYRVTVERSSPTVVRAIQLTSSTASPVAWTDASIQVLSPVPPDWVPIEGGGSAPTEVLIVDLTGETPDGDGVVHYDVAGLPADVSYLLLAVAEDVIVTIAGAVPARRGLLAVGIGFDDTYPVAVRENSTVFIPASLGAVAVTGVMACTPDFGMKWVAWSAVDAAGDLLQFAGGGGAGSSAWADLTGMPASIDAIDGLTPAADRFAYYTGSSAAALATLTAAGRALLDDADAAAQRTTLGLGSAALAASTDFDAAGAAAAVSAASAQRAANLGDLASAAAARSNLGLGSAATYSAGAFDAAGAAAAAQAASQPLDSDLTAIAALATTSFGRALLTLADAAAARTAIGAASGTGSASGTNTGDQTITLTGDVTGSGTGSFATTVYAPPGTEKYAAGSWYSNEVPTGGLRSVAPGAIMFFPIDLQGAATIDALLIDVATGAAGGLSHLYLLTSDATTGRPSTSSTILSSAANVSTASSSAVSIGILTAAQTRTRGRVWAAVHSIVGTATYRAVASAYQAPPPVTRATLSSANGYSCINAIGAGTSGTPLTNFAGLTFQSDLNQAPLIGWRTA